VPLKAQIPSSPSVSTLTNNQTFVMW